jgi:hypothetical protein
MCFLFLLFFCFFFTFKPPCAFYCCVHFSLRRKLSILRSSTGAQTVTFLCVQWSAETHLENSVHSFRALRYLPRSSTSAQTVTFLCVQWSAETRLENSIHSFRALRYLHGCILNCTFRQLIYRGRFCHRKCRTGSITVMSRTDNAILYINSLRPSVCLSDATVLRFNPPAEPARIVGRMDRQILYGRTGPDRRPLYNFDQCSLVNQSVTVGIKVDICVVLKWVLNSRVRVRVFFLREQGRE